VSAISFLGKFTEHRRSPSASSTVRPGPPTAKSGSASQACASTCRTIQEGARPDQGNRRRRTENYDYFAELEKWTTAVDPQSARLKYIASPDLKTDDWLDLAVPSPWQDARLPGFNGLVWFRHWIDVPKEWAGRELKLSLSIVNDIDITWLNAN